MRILSCETCQITFTGRPNKKYCSLKCKRQAEKKERERKRRERHEAWLAAMTPEDRAFYDSIPEFQINWTPEQEKGWDEFISSLPSLEEIMKGGL